MVHLLPQLDFKSNLKDRIKRNLKKMGIFWGILKNKGDIRNERPLLTDDCDIIAILHVRGDGTL